MAERGATPKVPAWRRMALRMVGAFFTPLLPDDYLELRRVVLPRMRKYELPYDTGPLLEQLGTVQRTVLRLAFAGGKPRPTGSHRGESL